MHDNELRNTLAERFEGYGSQPSDAVWAGIEGNLDQDDRKRGFFWWWIGLAGAAATVIVLLMVSSENTSTTMLSSDEKTNTQTELPATENQNTPATENSETEQSDEISTFENSTVPTNTASNQQTQNADSPTSPETKPEDEPTRAPLVADAQNDSPQLTDEPIEEENEERAEITAGLDTHSPATFPVGIEYDHYAFLSSPNLSMAPRWELSAEVSTFSRAPEIRTTEKSVITSNTSDNTSLTTENLSAPSTSDDIYATHTRYAEIQLTIRRKLGRRFQIGTGLSTSYSKNMGGTVSGDYQFKTNIWSVGIPVHVRFTALKYRRFSLTPYLSILNEFHFSSYSNEGAPPSNGSSFNADPALPLATSIKQNTFAFGVQPSVEISYYATERLSIGASFGYRNYFVRDNIGFSPAIRQPNYFQFAVGTAWILK